MKRENVKRGSEINDMLVKIESCLKRAINLDNTFIETLHVRNNDGATRSLSALIKAEDYQSVKKLLTMIIVVELEKQESEYIKELDNL